MIKFYKFEFYKNSSGNPDVIYLWTPETRILIKVYTKIKKAKFTDASNFASWFFIFFNSILKQKKKC